ncbi:MAG: transposase [Planctomycetes bacterium]|nr:transposase [Planctomycetota bacterium]
MDQVTLSMSILTTPIFSSDLLSQLIASPQHQLAGCVEKFLRQPPTPESTYEFETELVKILRTIGRKIMGWAFNNIEPTDPQEMPGRIDFEGESYRRKPKSFNRNVGTSFGSVSIERFLYEPLERGVGSIFPLEINLGIVARNATPALAERVGRLATDLSQDELRQTLRDDHNVYWSVETLRKVTAAFSESMTPRLHTHQFERLLDLLRQADASTGRHKVVLSVGRDGCMLPIRNNPTYKEAATATITVYDRRKNRLGTIYLAQMPEPGQGSLSAPLTKLLEELLGAWQGPMPRLVYVTDAGWHPTDYFHSQLLNMRDPRQPSKKLHWTWVVDFYHASEYIGKLARILFGETPQAHAWARKMCKWLKHKPNAVFRILHSAAKHHSERALSKNEEKQYRQAYAYLLRHKANMNYVEYQRLGLPIGSGITEAACKTIFTQRFKRSGMSWNHAGDTQGQRILDLRTIRLSRLWTTVHRDMLRNQKIVNTSTKRQIAYITYQIAA